MAYRSYTGGRSQRQNANVGSSTLFKGLSAQDICSIPVPSPYSTEDRGVITATNVVTLGSYNWVDHPVPTIIVPGSPSLWKEPVLPLQLSPDSGPTFIDQNAARSPKSPLEPMIRATSAIQEALGDSPSLSDEGVDIVTDRNNLRKLMRFICANGPNRDTRKNRTHEFRIDAQLAPNGKTLVLTRYEENAVDYSTAFKGYGHSFEEVVTTECLPPTAVSDRKITGYHRIIRYDLLSLRFMVRFEVDAMTDEVLHLPSNEPHADDADTLAEMFANTSLSGHHSVPFKVAAEALNQSSKLVTVEGSRLRHIMYGELVPQSSLIELKTLTNKFDVTWSDVYPQLFLSQTPTVKVAKHFRGMVSTVQTYTNASKEIQKAHSDLSQDFHALVTLLAQMRALAVKYKSMNKPLCFYWTGDGDLKVRTVERHDNLLSAKDLALF
ncbi:hypothetical protein FRC12_015880 [Ceratobasidium sp. 428]|nr:hypothetical protein FRC12_015880 [Ceratobasidium sp. 428]